MTSQANYTSMATIPVGESVLAGTFSLKAHPIVVLFDTRATHDFISKGCIQRHYLAIEPTNTPYVISTLGGKVITKQLVMYTPLNLARKLFKTSLIVLEYYYYLAPHQVHHRRRRQRWMGLGSSQQKVEQLRC
jgi:hypothetical protein